MPPGQLNDSNHRIHKGRLLRDIPGLTEEQIALVRKSRIEHMKSATPLKSAFREQKAHLETLLTTHPVDMKAVDQVTEEMAKNKMALLRLAIRHDQEIRSFLTPDQQVIFDSKPKPFLRKDKKKPPRKF
jgi:Spy/CpxP family protein refolding chaperone